MILKETLLMRCSVPSSVELGISEILKHMSNFCDAKNFELAEDLGRNELQNNSRLSESDKSEISKYLDKISILSSLHSLEMNPDQFTPETPPSSPRSP